MVRKKIIKKTADLEHLIEDVLLDAYAQGDLMDEAQGVKHAKSLKIPGLRKEDGSDCCGGGCCEVPEMNSEKHKTIMTKKEYLDIINQVLDPETGVGITDMGLIYDVTEKADGLLEVQMTLTSMGCPAGGQITTEIDAMLRLQPHVKEVKIEIVWEPAWNPGMMNEDVKEMLFGNSTA